MAVEDLAVDAVALGEEAMTAATSEATTVGILLPLLEAVVIAEDTEDDQGGMRRTESFAN